MEELQQGWEGYVRLTVMVVGMVEEWRGYLAGLDLGRKREQVDYYYQGENYLLRMLDDNCFVRKSFLADYFKFSSKNDPFLLLPILTI